MSARVPRMPRTLPISRRQREAWALVATGMTNKQIANAMGVSVGTVKIHLSDLFKRIGTGSRVRAAVLYRDAA
jgi:DNA-binding CsgD family transcriptional regulator